MLDNGCQIRMHLDDTVDRNSIKLEVDPVEENVKVLFARHSQEHANGSIAWGDDQPTTTTNYELQVNQTFKLSANKFDLNGITKTIQGQDLLLYIPFAKGFHPSSLNM